MIVGAPGAHHCDTQAAGELLRFDIEIVEHFDMIADKADRRDDDLSAAAGGTVANRLSDIGLEPRIPRPAAAALISDRPTRLTEPRANQARAALQLFDVKR